MIEGRCFLWDYGGISSSGHSESLTEVNEVSKL